MGLRILVIDDDETILNSMAEYFSVLGYQVCAVRGYAEALSRLAHERYALVIADVRMSGTGSTEGLDLAGHVRAWYPSTRIILLSGSGSPDVEARARRSGVDAFLAKPQPLPQVARLVSDLLVERPSAP